MNKEPLVSVILCTYNDEKYISQTIFSVLNQTYHNFEFIIWNDGSTDSTETIVKSFHDSRIRYFYHSNTGLGTALSLACKEANGSYIARIDGDDICFPTRFSDQVRFLESHKKYALVSTSVIYINKEGKQLGRSFPITWHSNIKKMMKKANPITHPTAMFRRDLYMLTGGYKGFKSAQDRMLWSQLIKYGKFKNLVQPLVYYRLCESSITSGWNNNPYKPIIEALRTKICNDSDIEEQDIELYNYINDRCNKKEKDLCPYRLSLEERIFNVLKQIIGESLSLHLIFWSKNLVFSVLR